MKAALTILASSSLAVVLASSLPAAPAAAAEKKAPVIARCPMPIGRIAIVDGDTQVGPSTGSAARASCSPA